MIEATDFQPSEAEGFLSFELKPISALSAEYSYIDENQVEHSGYVHYYSATETPKQVSGIVVAQQQPVIDRITVEPVSELCTPEVFSQAVVDAHKARIKSAERHSAQRSTLT